MRVWSQHLPIFSHKGYIIHSMRIWSRSRCIRSTWLSAILRGLAKFSLIIIKFPLHNSYRRSTQEEQRQIWQLLTPNWKLKNICLSLQLHSSSQAQFFKIVGESILVLICKKAILESFLFCYLNMPTYIRVQIFHLIFCFHYLIICFGFRL